MGTLYLVRHGQASFGADDYDHLSELGWRQSRRLGEWLAQTVADGDAPFDAVLTGTLRRHAQTWQGMVEGAGGASGASGALGHLTPLALPGLNEYDSAAVIAAIHPQPLPPPDTPELYRHHFRLLRDGLAAWMQGRTAPQGMPSHADFVRGVCDALDHVRQQHHGQRVLLVSSGGPIATAVAEVLQAPAATAIELNLRIRNTALTEFAFTPKRHMLLTFNTLPHLAGAPWREAISYA